MSELFHDPNPDARLDEAFFELEIPPGPKSAALDLLEPLKGKSPIHYEHYLHSVRVGILTKDVGAFLNQNRRALFLAGLLHDVGKTEANAELLGKKGPWTKEEREEIKKHVLAGYNLLKGKFDFVAEIILLHHKFQPDGYPLDMPAFRPGYPEGTDLLIKKYARLLALTDVYDALHRENSRFGRIIRLTKAEIRNRMLTLNPDRRELVEKLYDAGIFSAG